MANLPKKIWGYWDKGVNSAPIIVRLCVESWHENNTDWEINFLNDQNIHEFIDPDFLAQEFFRNLPIQKKSNIFRLYLLERYGGVWVDSTCYCTIPLNFWLHKYMGSGFFAFNSIEKTHIIANWFLASQPHNYLISSFLEEHIKYWGNFKPIASKKYRKFTWRIFRWIPLELTKNYSFWNSFPIRKILKTFPYFIFHYHLKYHLNNNERALKIFHSMPKFIPHHKMSPISELKKQHEKKIPIAIVKKLALDCRNPVMKLSWKADWVI